MGEATFFKDPNLTTIDIAQDLLGCLLVSDLAEGRTAGWIVETEAYLGHNDRAAHVYGGKRTARTEAFYHEAGIFYIYNIHGQLCLNMITQSPSIPQGVLIRALEPAQGLDLMTERRQKTGLELANGPGKLCQALAVDKERDYGTSVEERPLYIDLDQRRYPRRIASSARIGIPNKGDWTDKHLRFYVEGHPAVSKMPKRQSNLAQAWKEELPNN
ncbi:DNA-3-methyladenine glycosylase [Aerococcus sanguinicola]|uniref:DNA-3-methyladenine glycosylase n=1 Tax=unclassified Aerococcus TaxID=2618060 RepID=UPI0008A2AD67|nr:MULTISPECIES: DNA-3-methyladenine glycosylase [unclassified Aerococcus]MDK6232846.1 DNA-3-methyladenine glycosylase [Aerococcus sp. UMB10185]MDK6855736.1 DNA-3-methyladenine glycosylase [Aerococcus sp. UMB7533]MDK8502477.1 DNA-3-methyladenine glycosylase [Aerococcus sp. UMB1112A]OFN02569.1 hypothetical protein HMPREF2626_01250 [Aerococcus sp. HMSC062A02]OHO45248.1 hypothetical protein HMPREF2705_05245 [Aerococcus sp. HMSC035B07]